MVGGGVCQRDHRSKNEFYRMPPNKNENEALNWNRKTKMKTGVGKRCERYFTWQQLDVPVITEDERQGKDDFMVSGLER